MTIISSVIGRVVPGRYEEFVAQGLEVSKMYERLGAQEIRLGAAMAAGEASNTWVFSAEFDDGESYGAFTDAAATDGEFQSFLLRLRSPDNPAVVEQLSLAVEVDLGRKMKTSHGNISEVHVSRVTPGRLEEALATAKKACTFVERHGGRRARLFELSHAGSGSGLMMVSWEFENARAFGKGMDAWGSDPKGQAISAQLYSADSPTTIVFSGTYANIPL
jgi:hypothetical protein